jgi:exosortase C (VPDSG-CTERM-specific)
MDHGPQPVRVTDSPAPAGCPVSPVHGTGRTPPFGSALPSAPAQPRWSLFLILAGLLALGFALPFYHWAGLARRRDLLSHLPLVPFITAYLVWLQRTTLPSLTVGMRWPAAPLAVLAGGLLMPVVKGLMPEAENRLALEMLSFCLLLWGLGFLILGGHVLRRLAFPALFLIFMVPFPPVVEDAIEIFLQRASAETAFLFLQWAGIPVLRQGLTFDMPGLSIQVAPECSGIRSSWVLLMTSLLAGHLFLRSAWKRAGLALLVVPLGILRNGFRILVISWLCVYRDPSWIDSALHHRGGPIFFVLSLVPFTVLLLWLVKSDRQSGGNVSRGVSAGQT